MPTPGISDKSLITCRITLGKGCTGKLNIQCISPNQGTTEALGRKCKYPIHRFKDKSFSWGFWIFLVLFLGPAVLGNSLALPKTVSALLLGIAGSIPFFIQVITGYGLDASWTTKFDRSEYPWQYWSTLLLSIALAVAFWGTAYSRSFA